MGRIIKSQARDIHRQSTGAKKEVWVDLKPTGTYVTGGDDMNIMQVAGFDEALSVELSIANAGTHSFVVKYPNEGAVKNVKVIATVLATGAEVANDADITALRFRARIIGS